jgi:hypothetical protein
MVWLYWSLSHLPRQALSRGLNYNLQMLKELRGKSRKGVFLYFHVSYAEVCFWDPKKEKSIKIGSKKFFPLEMGRYGQFYADFKMGKFIFVKKTHIHKL